MLHSPLGLVVTISTKVKRLQRYSSTMPLSVPGLRGKNAFAAKNSIATNDKKEWTSKLPGKKITEDLSNNTEWMSRLLGKKLTEGSSGNMVCDIIPHDCS